MERMGFKIVGTLHVIIVGEKTPTAGDWKEYVLALQAEEKRGIDVTQMRSSLRELTENLDRLRRQLRDIELQADTQIASRLEASKSSSVEFDPLEMDRFTRFQELTRMMAESVNDVATVQRSITQTVQSAEDEMAAQARLTRVPALDLRDPLVDADARGSERVGRSWQIRAAHWITPS